jgi:hypothetical protein
VRAGVSVTGVALDVATQRRPVWPSSAGPPHGCRPGLAYGSTRPRPIPRPLAGGRLAMLVGRRLHLARADAVHASPGPLLDPSPSSQHTYCRTATPGQGCPRGQPCGHNLSPIVFLVAFAGLFVEEFTVGSFRRGGVDRTPRRAPASYWPGPDYYGSPPQEVRDWIESKRSDPAPSDLAGLLAWFPTVVIFLAQYGHFALAHAFYSSIDAQPPSERGKSCSAVMSTMPMPCGPPARPVSGSRSIPDCRAPLAVTLTPLRLPAGGYRSPVLR